jgi:ABC-2 type transport system ATP-binding protein
MLALAGAPAASAEDDAVTSFDGTRIVLHWFPTDSPGADGQAPTVLFGPGWAQAGQKNADQASDPSIGFTGVGALRAAGYNVLTWDPRGFGDSGGTVTVDSAENEGRDVQALIDYVAKQPEAQLDKTNDPRLGMTGASYGGGIQLVTAAIDSRVDVIAPDIAWNSLGTSLYKDDTFKGGWGTLLHTLGQASGTLDPHIGNSYIEGTATGRLSPENKQWFLDRGPGDLLKRIKIPTFLIQGTVDTLFTLDEAVTNYEVLAKNGIPLKMMWFCGGHGSCLTAPGDPKRVENATITWLNRHLRGDKSVPTGPGFDWIDQDGFTYTTPSYPPPQGAPITADGSGTLPLLPTGGSGPAAGGQGAVAAVAAITNGSRAANAVNVTLTAPERGAKVVGAPKLSLTYSGTAANSDVRVYGQLVDEVSGLVLGNLVTPLPLVLDGQPHTLDRELETVAHTLPPNAKLTLQITSSATPYDLQRTTGAVTFDKIKIELPTVKEGVAQPPSNATMRTRLGITRPRHIHRTAAGRHYLTAKAKASGGPLTKVRIKVTRGKKTIAKSSTFSLDAGERKSVRLKLKKRPKRGGGYTVTVAGTTAGGDRLTRTARVSLR